MANKITAIMIIKVVFCCLNLLRSESRILFNESLFFILSFVLKNGLNIHATNKIRINKRIRRTIKIYSLFLVTSIYVARPTVFQKHILPLPNNQLEKSIIILNPPCPYFLIRVQNFLEYRQNYLCKLSVHLKKTGEGPRLVE